MAAPFSHCINSFILSGSQHESVKVALGQAFSGTPAVIGYYYYFNTLDLSVKP